MHCVVAIAAVISAGVICWDHFSDTPPRRICEMFTVTALLLSRLRY
jgi:hypothetical protein